jgi:hypothetical protein
MQALLAFSYVGLNHRGIAMRLLATSDGLPRVSWGSVIAGVILSLISYVILSVLGAAIAASAVSPLSGSDSLERFGVGSGIYLIVMTVIAVFIGSYFAGRCAPALGGLHGLLAWAVMALLVVYGTTALIGGAISVVGKTAATGATVGATANQSGPVGNITNSIAQSAQHAVASAAAAVSDPKAQADARQAADTAASGVARASWFSFAALIIGAIIAIFSGRLGFRQQPAFEATAGVSHDEVAPASTQRRTPPPSRTVP